MLKSIDPLLSGALLQILDEMGHGDVLGLVDRNFPAHRYRRPVIELRAVDTAAAASAVLSVFPLDAYLPEQVQRMQIDDEPDEINAPTAALQRIADAAYGSGVVIGSLERFAFYAAAEGAYAFVQTGETVGYSCYLISKGVV